MPHNEVVVSGQLLYRVDRMHTVNSLRTTLGLSSANQVRNRIEAIKDVLAPHLRRGPNNQILITDTGVAMLRQVQELYDSGLTLTEASDVLRAHAVAKLNSRSPVSSSLPSDNTTPAETGETAYAALRAEVAVLRQRIASLETQCERRNTGDGQGAAAWWERLRGEIDVA